MSSTNHQQIDRKATGAGVMQHPRDASSEVSRSRTRVIIEPSRAGHRTQSQGFVTRNHVYYPTKKKPLKINLIIMIISRKTFLLDSRNDLVGEFPILG